MLSLALPVFPALEAANATGFVETSVKVVEGQNASVEGENIAGAAPLELAFDATIPADATYWLWEVAIDADFQNILVRYNETGFNRVFNQYGEYFVRFYCSDDSGINEWNSVTYRVNVYESRLECPNAFSPYGSPGINDEWKVYSKSIVEFDCVIFNSRGDKIAQLTSVEQGWDGKYKGKTVNPGVYFYVIRAKGADGREFNLSGDINLIGKR